MQFRKGTLFCITSVILTIISCAKKGMPTGGPMDLQAPKVVMSIPDNGSVNFNQKEIKIIFDEYVSLKDIDKQLIISPPQKQKPIVRPLSGVAKKYITIQIRDTLQPNTTYSFNFGKSIVDATESNPYENLKYIFSTGSYLDSLQVQGKIEDALLRSTKDPVAVYLYEVNEKHTDSAIYKQNPRYIATIDTAKQFTFDNIKAGKYVLVGIADKNQNNRFDPVQEKIGFHKETITVPSQDVYNLKLFKEIAPFKSQKPRQESGNQLLMGYKGDATKLDIQVKNGDKIIPSKVTPISQKDSVHIWYQPVVADSLEVVISNKNYYKNYSVKIKEKTQDTLRIGSSVRGAIHFRDTLQIQSATPLIKINSDKIKLFLRDSIAVKYTTSFTRDNKALNLFFEKLPETKYRLQLLPDAVEDFFGNKNKDTLAVAFQTNLLSDYGNLTVVVQKAKRFPVVIQLLNDKNEVVANQEIKQNQMLNFDALLPNIYQLRAIYDDNQNGKWDTGDFLQKIQPEEVYYFNKKLDVRMNWDVNQPFDLSQ